jgi:alpha/beta superfamily hydrolase
VHASSGRATEVAFRTADGVDLSGELLVPAGARAAAIICHPHPLYGGTRFDHVVGALFAGLPEAGIAALRFDFRRDFGGGVAEVGDAVAALAELRRAVPGVPLVACGYSFGAMVVLGVDAASAEGTVAGKVLVAPPLTAMPAARPDDGRDGAAAPVPTLVLSPEHDQFTPASAAEPIVAAWAGARFAPIAMADHFLHGRTGAVVDAVVPWIAELVGALDTGDGASGDR